MGSTQEMLLTKLRQLECHFTWGLEDIELNDLQNKLRYNTKLSTGFDRKVIWSYNYLAYTKYTQNLLQEAQDDLVKAENYIRENGGAIDESDDLEQAENYIRENGGAIDESDDLEQAENYIRENGGAIDESDDLEQAENCIRENGGAIDESDDLEQAENYIRENGGAIDESDDLEQAENYIRENGGAIDESDDLEQAENYIRENGGAIDESDDLEQAENYIREDGGAIDESDDLEQAENYIRENGGAIDESDDLEQAENYIREDGGAIDEKKLIVTYGNLAWVYYHQGDYTRSQSYLDKLDEIDMEFPVEPPAVLHAAVYGEKGWTCQNSNEQYFEEARKCFAKALEMEPKEIEWNEGYAVALYRTETHLTSLEESPATKQLRRVLELDPNNALIMALLGLKHADYKESQRAQELLERAIELEPKKPYVIRHVAKFYRKNGRVDESISLLERALKITPDSSVLHHQFGLSYAKKNRADEDENYVNLRIHHLERAVSLKPSFIHCMLDLGSAYVSAGDYIKAEEMYEKATKMATAKNQHRQMVALQYANFLKDQKIYEPFAVRKYKEGLQLQKDTVYWEECASKLENIAEDRIRRNPCDGKAFEILDYVKQMRGQNQ